MRLASLTLQGFKSFGNRTTVEFADGVTAVVGPNGSGKSNLIEALKWTSGGGRAREFRAEEKTDLIFHGAAGKRSVGLAEVEVELTGAGGGLKLYRSLDREGTTRLRLNGRAARFLDLDEALAGSGLGRAGLAIIGQGEVSRVLMADPPKLLEYVAETAGVSRLAGRREQTRARLETAAGHLDRLQDVLTELTAACEALAGAAREAEAHARLSAEALQLGFTAAVARKEALTNELAGLSERRLGLETALREGRERLAELREGGAALSTRRDEVEEAYRKASAELEYARGNVRLLDARVASLRQRAADTDASLARLRDEAELLASAARPDEPELSQESAASATEDALAREAAALEDLQVAREAADAARAASDAAAAVSSAAERAAEVARSRERALADQVRSASERLAVLEGELATVDVAELEARFVEVAADADRLTQALEADRERLRELHEAHALANAEAVAKRHAADRTRSAFEARRGYAQGPRNALTAGIAGVLGAVADLVRVAPEYETAVAGALGRRAEYVVVDDAETGAEVLEHVRRSGGFVTVLPLDLVRRQASRGVAEVAAERGVLGAVTDLIETDDQFVALFEQLLGGTALVESMQVATGLARRFEHRPRLVTLEGDTLEASGAMSGGRRSQHATVLGLAAELEDAEAAAAESEAAAAGALSALQVAQAGVRQLVQQGADAAKLREMAAAELAQAREHRAGNERLTADLRERLERLEAESKLAAGSGAPDVAELERLTAAADAARSEAERAFAILESARAAAGEAQLAAAAANQAAALVAERWRSYQADLERYYRGTERLAAVRSELAAQAELAEGLDGEVERAVADRDAAAAELPTDLGGQEEALAVARRALAEFERELTAQTEAQARRAQELEESKVQAARRETALELAAEDLLAFPDGLPVLEMSERAARARLRTVQEELDGLGPVNHRAAADLRDAQERLEGLQAEAVQASLAVQELEATLERIDRETTERLSAALTHVRGAFAEHVEQLFGDGGYGGIDVENEEGRPTGLRIQLQPPGKQTRSLHLLSVGERTMGALAFLFALMGHGSGGGRLPIAVLDEVDAPLDEANIRRFRSFVTQLAAAGTQFVLITHQKATFEAAEALWGVTTEGGVSRVFSIKRDAVAAAS